MDSTYFFADRPILSTRLDNLFHAIALIPSGNLNRLNANRDKVIAAIQLDILWSVAAESSEPTALMALAPWRLIYGNVASGGRSLCESWSEAERDLCLIALIREGEHRGSGVRSRLFSLQDGRKIVLQISAKP
jgi:hypothetical protein